MKVKSHIHSMMRGSVAGITYTANRYSAIVARNRTIPIQPNTTFQQLMRSSLAWCSAQWEQAAPGIRTGWAEYALTVTLSGPQGDYTPTGRDMFIAGLSLHHYLLLRGLIAEQTDLNEPEFDGLMTFTEVLEYTPVPEPTIGITLHNLNVEAAVFHVQRSLAYTPAHMFHKGPWTTRDSAVLQIAGGDNDQYALTPVQAGRNYFFRIRCVANRGDNGQQPHRISSEHLLRVATYAE